MLIQITFIDPPVFEPIQPEVTIGVENEPLMITVKADGNPGSISYTWTKDGLPITQASYSQSSMSTNILKFVN